MAGLNIIMATESLGSLLAPGSFTFDADPGELLPELLRQSE
jgi:hypothetical protein